MIYDCFPFFNEADALEIRLQELDLVVDKFVIFEAVRSFSGQPHEPVIQALFQTERFSKWRAKLVSVIVEDPAADLPPEANDERTCMARERRFREAWKQGMADRIRVRLDDTLSWSDADEIPRASVLRALSRKPGLDIVALSVSEHRYFLNCRFDGVIQNSKILSGAEFHARTEHDIHWFDGPRAGKLIRNAGWHFALMGGAAARNEKLLTTPHVEGGRSLSRLLEATADVTKLSWGNKLLFVEAVTEHYPAWVRQNEAVLRLRGLVK